MPRGIHPNTRAALAKHVFKPGQSGTPKGRPASAGATIKEWLNTLGEKQESDVRAVMKDESQPIAKRIAANMIMQALVDGDAFDRVMDRTEGKPRQAVEHSGELLAGAVRVIVPGISDGDD